MMTVLNSIEITRINPWCARLGIIGVLAFAASLILLCKINNLEVSFAFFEKLMIVAIVCIGMAIIGTVVFPEVPTGKFQIEATFTDDFSFTSVMKEYEVIEQRGDIFVLEPKEREVG